MLGQGDVLGIVACVEDRDPDASTGRFPDPLASRFQTRELRPQMPGERERRPRDVWRPEVVRPGQHAGPGRPERLQSQVVGPLVRKRLDEIRLSIDRRRLQPKRLVVGHGAVGLVPGVEIGPPLRQGQRLPGPRRPRTAGRDGGLQAVGRASGSAHALQGGPLGYFDHQVIGRRALDWHRACSRSLDVVSEPAEMPGSLPWCRPRTRQHSTPPGGRIGDR